MGGMTIGLMGNAGTKLKKEKNKNEQILQKI